MRKTLAGLLAGISLALASGTSAWSTELTIFWAEWDPANYLQELVNEYEAETGVKVNVETTPWADFQTKAFTEFNAKGDAYDMVVGDSQWLGAGSTGGHYVDLTDFFNANKLSEVMAPATVKSYAEYGGKYWAVPLEGDAVGWSYRKDWFEDPKEMEAFKAKYGYDLAVPKDWKALRDIAEFFNRPDEKRYGIAIYTDNSYDAMVMGVENAMFLLRWRTGRLSRPTKLMVMSIPTRRWQRSSMYQEALQLHASRLGQDASSWKTTRQSPKAWRQCR